MTVAFDGVDITQQMTPYLLSLTYTDNESDETDDLQIKIHDRDGVWAEKWLNDAVTAAASTVTPEGEKTTAKKYRVTPKIGLNVRSGPSTKSSKYGALSCGTEILVSEIKDGWASTEYKGKAAYVSAAYIKEVSGAAPVATTKKSSSTDKKTEKTSTLRSALTIEALITSVNRSSDGKDAVLDCGMFELDSVKADGPPATITIKATSLPYSATIRQTKKTKAWEAFNLSKIANEMATANGMTLMFSCAADPYYARVEQSTESDIEFLRRLCHNAGISLKATNKILVLFDQAAYEKKTAVRKIFKGDGSYTKYAFQIGKADAQYQSCRVRYTPPNGKLIEGIAYIEDYKADNTSNQQLEVTAKVADIGEAQKLAAMRLRLHNKYSQTAEFSFPFDPTLVAGATVEVSGWGAFDGKYIGKTVVHSVGSSGATTKFSGRKVLEGH
ncbi:MAG: SH3 domain-containing protein [Oscillospiraceae bacterium]|nr:SH3 domain-containing protein [Oscillospiraceae bacterium]